MKTFVVAFIALLATSALADVYMHNPRGSNNRENEANTNRNNANRLFNSQNNAKGGYCNGPMMNFYEGSFLSVSWTNQHGCGNPKLYCNLVIQYMCTAGDAPDDLIVRDGETTDTIPNDPTGPTTRNQNNELQYGMHEPRPYYVACTTRDRNMGLWISDREAEGGLNEGRASARFTRQENNGDRYGYECPEDKDYYPYWHATPWRDVAVLTEDLKYCDFYRRESFNVKDRNECQDASGNPVAPNNQVECLATTGNRWATIPAHGIPAPDCVRAPWTRDNHLGAAMNADAQEATYNMTMPTANVLPCISNPAGCRCVLRLRYNMSSADVGGTANPNGNAPDSGFIDYRQNGPQSPVTEDPFVSVAGFGLQLAIDTTQFFRTFQDRSHTFNIRPRPSGIGGISALARIFNLNVRGKRGNIVQAYPATEYDFIPNNLLVRVGDYIHFQWTGCDTNPAGNAGNGRDQWDRSNIVQVENGGTDMPVTDQWLATAGNKPLFPDPEMRKRFAFLGQTDCLNYAALLQANNNNENAAEQDLRNCGKLNGAPAYFDGGAVQMNITGEYHFVSTRNNDFSNRDQRGVIVVENLLPTWGIVIVVIGGFLFLVSLVLAGMVFYAKSHPHSGIAGMVNKM